MSAEILAFRSSTPVIQILGTGDGYPSYMVNVRPCPEGIQTLWTFRTYEEALNHAVYLQDRYGWQIDVGCQSEGAA